MIDSPILEVIGTNKPVLPSESFQKDILETHAHNQQQKYPANILNVRTVKDKYIIQQRLLFKVNSKNTRKRCEVFSELTIRTSERRQWQ